MFHIRLPNTENICIFTSTETVGETFVSSDCWGEDSNYELADAAHFHVASSAFNF
jgi:hypothetical protein